MASEPAPSPNPPNGGPRPAAAGEGSQSAASGGSRPRKGGEPDLAITWSPVYHAAWDDTPEAYLAHGVVAWGRSRRLARLEDARRAFTGYLGVQHADPARWHGAGEPRTVFFVSLFVLGRTVALRTFPTLGAALAEARRFHAALRGPHGA